jgi:uncharacterized protein YggT (Ycf19 family)
MSDYKDVRTSEHEQGSEQRFATFRVTQIIWLLLGLLEVLIGLRFVFKLIAVNGANPFAELIYNITKLFVAPFASLTSAPSAGGMVLEISSLIAMIVYLLVAWGLERIVYVALYRQRGQMSTRQTTYVDHNPAPATEVSSQSVTTDRVVTQAPLGGQTTVTQQTNTHTPGPL